MSQPKKKFKETKVGKFLLGKSGIINVISNILPDQGALGMVKNLIDKDEDLTPQDKETALKLLEQDTIELQEVSKRWSSDMKSDSWLSKNTRPMTLIFLTISLVIFILLDGFDISFGIDTGWIDLLKSLLITVYVAYFGSRGAEKFKSIGKDTPIFYERYLKDLSNEYAIKNTISSALAFTKSEYKKDNSLKLLKIKLKKQTKRN